ncbi:unnamed protein product [Hymenolepis diminuta]|uniref:C2H2-type domain-containing protein n=1 Tax=Hymenolepis diminuta TaxID=6216 RepID=A0A3P6ZDB9_HYMDI|nr:unnamed protein product [Hymenolepis diminuta]
MILSNVDFPFFLFTEVRPFTCEECGKSFALAIDVRNHIECVHKGIRKSTFNFSPLCLPKLSFFFLILLNKIWKKKNVETRQRVLPYSCKYCEKSFPTTEKLSVHLTRPHKESFNQMLECSNQIQDELEGELNVGTGDPNLVIELDSK